MKNISHFLSFIFSPLLEPVYGVAIALWFSVLHYVPTSAKWTILLWVFGLNTLLPALAVLLLKQLKIVSSFGLNDRSDRAIPYAIVCVGYLITAWMMTRWNSPAWLWQFMLGAAAAVVISVIVNHWWKISAHMAGMGGTIGLMLRIFSVNAETTGAFGVLIAVILLTGAVGSARIYLGRHTLGQVIAGTLNGALCVYFI